MPTNATGPTPPLDYLRQVTQAVYKCEVPEMVKIRNEIAQRLAGNGGQISQKEVGALDLILAYIDKKILDYSAYLLKSADSKSLDRY